jgi:hypothetical protein
MVHPRGSIRAWSAPVWDRRYAIVYFGLVAWFLMRLAGFYDPHTRFTSLEWFGDRFEARRLARLRDVPIHTLDDSNGYDGQFYAQLAVAGNPFDPEIPSAIDNAAYRSQRILLPMLAHGLGLGRPSWVLNAYALLGIAFWIALAWVLARFFFPPTDLHNLLRWIGTLFGAGMLESVVHALADAPTVLFLAVGMLLLEKERFRLGAAVLASAGLVRETSVLFASAFLRPWNRGGKARIRVALGAVACVLPALLWYVILRIWYGPISVPGAFDLPFVGMIRKFGEALTIARASGLDVAWRSIWIPAAILTQVAFHVARPRPGCSWWRIGAAFSILCIFMGPAVWEGWPGAAPRALLPLSLSFNVLCPRSRGGLALLLVGNLSVLSTPHILSPPPREQTTLVDGIRYEYGEGWHGLEGKGSRTARWTSGSAVMRFHNPTSRTREVTLDFGLVSKIDRKVRLKAGDLEKSVVVRANKVHRVGFGPFPIAPGQTTILWTTAEPPWIEPLPNHRSLAFRVRELKATVSPPGPAP